MEIDINQGAGFFLHVSGILLANNFVVFLLCLYFILTVPVISEMHSVEHAFLMIPLYKRSSMSSSTFTETYCVF